MGKIEMIYAASIGINIATVVVTGTILWQALEDKYKCRKRAKAQRIANKVDRHYEFIRNNEDYKAVLKW